MKTLAFNRRPAAAPEGAAASASVVALATARFAPQRSLRRWLRLLGWPGILGIGVLVMCATFYLSTLQPAAERLRETQQSAASLRDQMKQAGEVAKGPERPVAEQLAEFYKLFPNEKDLPDWLAKVFAAAQAQGLVLEQGEYKTQRDKIGHLMHYEITLPVKGEYPQIRKFLAALTRDVPIVGLQQIEFERQKVGTPTVDSKIRLVLYLEQQT
jgi:Tfp pilus assembly protein PilO